MNLIDKYILEVGKHLPRKNRLDLQTEIRSTLEDMLEDRSKSTGKPVDEGMVNDILKEFGAPSKVAEAYQPTRYLIGPRLYPFFEMVVKIVLTVLTVVSLIGMSITFVSTGGSGIEFAAAFGKWILEYLTSLISAFGNIVLVFAILERVVPGKEFDIKEAEKWTPADLNAEPDPDAVKRSELIFEILFVVLGLALFNLYPHLIGIATVKDGTWIYFPALSDVFFRYLPWINLLGGLQILLDLFLLRQGIWQTLTRLGSLALEVSGIVLAVIMLIGPSLVDTSKLADSPIGSATDVLIPLVSFVPILVLIILIVIQSIESIQLIWKLLNQRKASQPFLPKM